MPVVDNSKQQEHALPGLRHRTVGGKGEGVLSMEVWQQTIAAGAATPVHRHACEEVIVILSGSGTLMINGETTVVRAQQHAHHSHMTWCIRSPIPAPMT